MLVRRSPLPLTATCHRGRSAAVRRIAARNRQRVVSLAPLLDAIRVGENRARRAAARAR